MWHHILDLNKYMVCKVVGDLILDKRKEEGEHGTLSTLPPRGYK